MNSTQNKLIGYCYDLLARRRYSIREMVKKLDLRNARLLEPCTDEELQQILAALLKANLINDNDFADFYISGQLRRKPIGKLKIRQQLRQKGISEDVIAHSINKATLDESELALQLLAKKAKIYQPSQLRDPKVQQRLIRYLASNGFSPAQSFQALKNISSHSIKMPLEEID